MADDDDLLEGAGDEGGASDAIANASDDAGEQQQGEAKSFDVEEFASRMGWSPKDKWRGDPEAWKPADQFVESTVSFNKTLKRDVKALKETTERMARATATMTERAVAEERSKWEARHAEAVEANDTAGAFQAAKEITRLDAEPKPSSPTVDSSVQEFVERNNAWFGVDPIATAFAQQVAEVHKSKPYAEQVEIAEREVKKRFPELFLEARPATKAQPAVNAPSSNSSSARARAKGFAELPAEAKTAALAGEKRGRWSRDEYATSYWNEENA